MENYTTIEQTKKGLSAAQSSITTVKKALDDRITALAEAVTSAGGDNLVVDLWHPYDEEASAETDYESEIYRSELSVTPEEIIAASRSKKLVLLQDHYDGATPESPSPKYYPCLYTLVTAFERWHHNDDKSGNSGYRLIFKEFNNNDYQASIIEANYYDGVSYRELSFVNYGALTINIDTAIAKERESTLRDYFDGAGYVEEGHGKVTFTSPDRRVPWETDPTDSTVFEGTDYGVHMHAWEDLEYENPFTHIDAELTSKTYVAEKIAEAMTDVDNEHFHPVTALPDPADEDTTKRPKENHEYILIEYEQDGTTIKSETHYLFYGGEYHEKKTTVSLDGYATEQYVNDGLATKQDALTPGNGVEILPDGTINMTKNVVRQSTVLWEGSYNDVRSGAITLSADISEYDEICAMSNSGEGVAQSSRLGSIRFTNGVENTTANAYMQWVVSFNGNTATVDGSKLGTNGNYQYTLKEPLTKILGIKYEVAGGGSGSLPQGGYKGQALVKQSTADGDAVWGTPSFDTYLNEISTNAVQNKVVAADIKTRARGWIDRKTITYFTTNEGEEQLLPTTAGQVIEVESGMGMYRATLTQADIDGINAATATAGHIVRVYFEYDETDFYDVEIKNTGEGKGYYGLDTGNPDPDYRYPGLPGHVYKETVYQIDKRLIPSTVDQTYDATSENAQSGKAVAEAIASSGGGSSSGISAFDGNYYSRGYLHDILTRYGNGRGTYWSPDGYGDPDTNGGYQAYYSIDEATTNYSSAPRIISRTNYAGKFPAKIASIYVEEFRDRYVFSFNNSRNGSPATGTGLPTGFHAIDIEWAFEYPKLTKGYKTTGIYSPRQFGIPLKIENSSLSSPSYVTFEDNTYQLFSSQNMAAFLDLSRTGYVAIGVTLFLTKSFSEGSTKGIKDYNIGGFQFEVPKAWLDLGLEDTEGYWS